MRNWKVITIFAILTVMTLFYVVKTPLMHKPFQVNIIEYILKFNDDGSVTTTKSTTTTIINDEGQADD